MKPKNSINPEIKRILTGSGAGTLLFFVGTIITAVILTKNDLSLHTVRCVVFTVTAAACFIAGFVGKRHNRMKGIVCGAIAAAAVLLIEWGVLLSVDRLQTSEEALLLIPAGILFGALGGIVSSNVR